MLHLLFMLMIPIFQMSSFKLRHFFDSFVLISHIHSHTDGRRYWIAHIRMQSVYVGCQISQNQNKCHRSIVMCSFVISKRRVSHGRGLCNPVPRIPQPKWRRSMFKPKIHDFPHTNTHTKQQHLLIQIAFATASNVNVKTKNSFDLIFTIH